MKHKTGLTLLAVLLAAGLTACGSIAPATAAAATAQSDILVVDAAGNSSVDTATLATAIASVPAGDLTAAEVEGLLYMREEEKLARDVYLALYDTWQQPTFQNIASAEQTHMDAIETLLERYDLDDPTAGKDYGEFTNPDLQSLYDQLAAEGNQSLEAALRVGAAIEEIDILDLEKHLTETEREDIQLVYENLLRGSRNHLRAFVSTLQRQGATYEPQYMSLAAYDAILSSGVETGGHGSRGNDGGEMGHGSRDNDGSEMGHGSRGNDGGEVGHGSRGNGGGEMGHGSRGNDGGETGHGSRGKGSSSRGHESGDMDHQNCQ